jgi:hypothetical protein
MTENDPRDSEYISHGDIELSETLEKSAEVVAFEPSSEFEMPPMMAMDFSPPEEATPTE